MLTEYQWDYENRLIAADTDGDGTFEVQNQYDADGIRVAQTAGADETRFLIDPNRPYAQVLEEYTPGGIIKVSYVHGLDLISQNRAGAKSFYHVDGLGSTRALSDALGLVTDFYIYDAFGRTIGQVGATGNLFLFAGEQQDSALGLDYLRARYLDIGSGRFLTRDALSGVVHEPVTGNRFIYANQNPINRIDPAGSFSLIESSAVLAIRTTARTIAGNFGRLGPKQGIQIVAVFTVVNTIWRAASNIRSAGLIQIANGDAVGGQRRYEVGTKGIHFATVVIEKINDVLDIAFLAKDITELLAGPSLPGLVSNTFEKPPKPEDFIDND